jgi:hypothetical protein
MDYSADMNNLGAAAAEKVNCSWHSKLLKRGCAKQK